MASYTNWEIYDADTEETLEILCGFSSQYVEECLEEWLETNAADMRPVQYPL